MASYSASTWIRLCGLAAIALLVIFSLIGALAQPRTSLGWQLEHFIGYFAATLAVCAAWPRPFAVAGALVGLAGMLESLQALTPDRHPNVLAVFWGAGGVLVASVLAELFIRARKAASETRKSAERSNSIVEGD